MLSHRVGPSEAKGFSRYLFLFAPLTMLKAVDQASEVSDLMHAHGRSAAQAGTNFIKSKKSPENSTRWQKLTGLTKALALPPAGFLGPDVNPLLEP
ncbi:uncharacterized protein FOMMEDRAFT_154024 [Fomitiporia mediterranea MF3/22]|uniref:uncharacterized protein n=1 Tax=Fomitiporia mediterranea (strain MF3/22) TaxID=694068 RepID=UPI00044098FE|nr:uncharacterized protein FOMMEDRAFT_154024 [Fomitiporia mediterranea MF3/22]EJD04885.1 hypothetical protein FOMMEDRAFT_154024 [Fomitiporia mediterranea MF3/22]